jgi:hypothetical protein
MTLKAFIVSAVVEAYQPEGEGTSEEGSDIPAAGVFNAGIPDWHIYAHWKHVIGEKTPTPVKCPWECPYHTKSSPVQYDPKMNPNTLAYLGRVCIWISPPK